MCGGGGGGRKGVSVGWWIAGSLSDHTAAIQTRPRSHRAHLGSSSTALIKCLTASSYFLAPNALLPSSLAAIASIWRSMSQAVGLVAQLVCAMGGAIKDVAPVAVSRRPDVLALPLWMESKATPPPTFFVTRSPSSLASSGSSCSARWMASCF